MRMSRKQTSGSQRQRLRDCACVAVGGHGGDLEPGPQARQVGLQRRGQQRLRLRRSGTRRRSGRGIGHFGWLSIVGAGAGLAAAGDGRGRHTSASVPPSSSPAALRREPEVVAAQCVQPRAPLSRPNEDAASPPAPTPPRPDPTPVSRTISRARRLSRGPDLDAAAGDLGLQPVPDRVLDQRLQQQRRHRQAGQRGQAARVGSAGARPCAPASAPGSRAGARTRRPAVRVPARDPASVARRKAIRWSSIACARCGSAGRSARAGWPAC
jgi:hypothetical protein